MSIEDFIIWTYCCIDDWYTQHVDSCQLRRRGFAPALSDSEVITMEIVGEFLGYDGDKGIWKYFKGHWLSLFPDLGSRPNFAKQASNLWAVKQIIWEQLVKDMGAYRDPIHIVDGFPMPTCGIARAKRSRLFQNEAAYSYCASKKQKFYGFEGQVMITFDGLISGFTVVPANVDERDALWDMVEKIRGLLIGDKGYIRPVLKSELEQEGIDLQTPLRKNMKDDRSPEAVKRLMSTRRLVETVIGQLSEQFHIEKVRARDLWHLTNRVVRKILAHTLGVFFNRKLGRSPLHLADLVDA